MTKTKKINIFTKKGLQKAFPNATIVREKTGWFIYHNTVVEKMTMSVGVSKK